LSFRQTALIVLLLALFASPGIAKEKYIFYHAYNYGSQAVYNPLGMTISATFDVLQINNRTNDLKTLHLANGFANVWANFIDPLPAVKEYGYKQFFSSEIFPLGLAGDSYQYVPNYTLHLIGGGMTYIATAEWYEYHGYPKPRLLSGITMAAMHFFNEALENNAFDGYNVDPIADLWLFDPGGLVLFSFPRVAEFFATTLHLNDWSPQTLYYPDRHEIYNNGQKFSFKLDIPRLDHWRLFYLVGAEGIGGFSYRLNSTDDISVAAGIVAHDLRDVPNPGGARKQTVTLVYSEAIFWDRNGSLLSSLVFGGNRGYAARLNIYPGVVKVKNVSPGLIFMLRKNGEFMAGINFTWLPVGLAAKMGRF